MRSKRRVSGGQGIEKKNKEAWEREYGLLERVTQTRINIVNKNR